MKQAPRSWYAILNKYIQLQGFKIGTVDIHMYIKFEDDHLLIIVVYVDDIIFGSDLEQM